MGRLHISTSMSHDTDPRADTLPCPACETEIAVADSFCRSCGANVAGIDETGRLTSCPECGTDDDRFYVVDQGEDPTSVNREELEEGDRVPVSPGDRIDLSGVANIGIREA